jgi:hypothetical protein
MILNPFILKKWAALILSALLTVICFFVGVTFYNLWVGLGLMFVGLFTGLVVGNVLLKNPFTLMLEGKGILAVNLDSTGILKFFVLGIRSPYIVGKLWKKMVKDVFDRNTVYNIAAPIKAGVAEWIKKGEKKGGLKIELTEEELNKARFGFYHYPVIVYNEQI